VKIASGESPSFQYSGTAPSHNFHLCIIGSFATDVNQAAGAVDVVDPKQASLFAPQAAGVDGREE